MSYDGHKNSFHVFPRVAAWAETTLANFWCKLLVQASKVTPSRLPRGKDLCPQTAKAVQVG